MLLLVIIYSSGGGVGWGLGGEGERHQFRWVKNENTMEHNGYYIGMSVQAVSFK